MDVDGGRERLGREVKTARLRAGLAKEAAGREAGISSITWTRVEDGDAVQDVKLAAVERVLVEAGVWSYGDAARFRAGLNRVPSGSGAGSITLGGTATYSSAPPERPVGLGLDDEATDLRPEQIEAVRAMIRAMKPPPETP